MKNVLHSNYKYSQKVKTHGYDIDLFTIYYQLGKFIQFLAWK